MTVSCDRGVMCVRACLELGTMASNVWRLSGIGHVDRGVLGYWGIIFRFLEGGEVEGSC